VADGNVAMQSPSCSLYRQKYTGGAKMNTIFEQMGGRYIQCGDYLIPNLELPDEDHYLVGKYGRMRMNYLKEHRPVIYNQLILSGKLYAHLGEIEQTCQDRMERMILQLKEAEGVTEILKVTDQMEWVRRMNSIHNRAEEIILSELLYG